MRNQIQGNPHDLKDLAITRLHCTVIKKINIINLVKNIIISIVSLFNEIAVYNHPHDKLTGTINIQDCFIFYFSVF